MGIVPIKNAVHPNPHPHLHSAIWVVDGAGELFDVLGILEVDVDVVAWKYGRRQDIVNAGNPILEND